MALAGWLCLVLVLPLPAVADEPLRLAAVDARSGKAVFASDAGLATVDRGGVLPGSGQVLVHVAAGSVILRDGARGVLVHVDLGATVPGDASRALDVVPAPIAVESGATAGTRP